jgi:hypothetical protein
VLGDARVSKLWFVEINPSLLSASLWRERYDAPSRRIKSVQDRVLLGPEIALNAPVTTQNPLSLTWALGALVNNFQTMKSPIIVELLYVYRKDCLRPAVNPRCP